MTTNSLLKKFVWLRDEIAAHGPSPRLRAVRGALNVILRIYRAEQRYARLKAKTGVVLEFFERDTPLTEQDAANLKAASAVNRQITEVLRERRNGAQRSSRNVTGEAV